MSSIAGTPTSEDTKRSEGGQVALGQGRLVNHGLRGDRAIARFMKDFCSHLLAGSAAGGDAKRRLQVPKRPRTSGGGPANLLIGYGVADTYVHDFNHLLHQQQLILNANDCQYD